MTDTDTQPGPRAALQAALAEGAQRWGVGSGASHLVSGHSRAHAALEDALADWLAPTVPGGRALGLCTGYMANLALLTALGDGQATLLCDKLNHASLIDAALLARAEVRRYPHARMDRLAAELERLAAPWRAADRVAVDLDAASLFAAPGTAFHFIPDLRRALGLDPAA